MGGNSLCQNPAQNISLAFLCPPTKQISINGINKRIHFWVWDYIILNMCNVQFYANAYLYQKSSVETPMICKWLVVSTLGLLIQIKLFNEELSPFITSIRNVKTYYSHHLGQLNKNRNVSTLDFLTQIKLFIAALLI